MTPRTRVYIDALNLYYGAVRHTPYKWLDVAALCSRLLPDNDVKHIRYFTAKITQFQNDPDAPTRQMTYIRALQTVPDLTVHLGSFRKNRYKGPLVNPPRGGPTHAEVWKPEEKGSDVNLATHLLTDGFRDEYDVAAVITNDSDLTEPIRILNEELGLPVGVINPYVNGNTSGQLREAARFNRKLSIKDVKRCQLANPLHDEDGEIHKPPSW